MKLVELISCYNALSHAQICTLDDEEAVKVMQIRKAMRPHINDYTEYEKDCHDKLYSDEAKKLEAKLASASKEEYEEIAEKLSPFKQRLNEALSKEWNKEIDFSCTKLKACSVIRIIKENKWEIGVMDLLNFMTE